MEKYPELSIEDVLSILNWELVFWLCSGKMGNQEEGFGFVKMGRD
jgi:hypothetical protein